jgi:hypothetical protein
MVVQYEAMFGFQWRTQFRKTSKCSRTVTTWTSSEYDRPVETVRVPEGTDAGRRGRVVRVSRSLTVVDVITECTYVKLLSLVSIIAGGAATRCRKPDVTVRALVLQIMGDDNRRQGRHWLVGQFTKHLGLGVNRRFLNFSFALSSSQVWINTKLVE